MPPKVKITKKEIIETTLELIRRSGTDAINARSIAAALECSTQPIFSNFSSMEELYENVTSAAHDLYFSFLQTHAESGKYPKYKAFGMAYILFAKEEKELFKFLFMRDRTGDESIETSDFEASVEMIINSIGVTRDVAEIMHIEMWAFVHGIAVMYVTSFLNLDLDLVSNMLTDIYQGIKARHLSKENL